MGVSVEGIEQASTYPNAVRSVLAQYVASLEKPLFWDKTPSYALHIPLLTALGAFTGMEIGPLTAPFPFIIGSPRSGTTLLRSMLDEHPGMAIPSESHFIPRLMGSPRTFAESIKTDPHFLSWGVDTAGLEDAGTYGEAIRWLFAHYASSRGKVRYGDKTPGYAFHLPLLSRLFPEAVFIHILRDGRDAALSMLDVGFASNLDRAIVKWRRHVEAARLAGRRLGPRYLEVPYEGLVERTDEVLHEICRFVELDFEPCMLDYHERISAEGRYPRQPHLRHAPVRTRDWRTQLDATDRARLIAVAGDLLHELGYAEPTPATIAQRLGRGRARLADLRAELRGRRGSAYR